MRPRMVVLIVVSLAFAGLEIAGWQGALPARILGHHAALVVRALCLISAVCVGLTARSELWENFWSFALIPTTVRFFIASPLAPAKYEQNLFPLMIGVEVIYLLLLAALMAGGFGVAKLMSRPVPKDEVQG